MKLTNRISPSGARYQRIFFLIITILTGALFAILISLTSPGADDLLFMIPMKGHEAGPGLWQMMLGEMPRIWTTQSGRLGNFLSMPFLYLMPKWIFGIISGIFVALLITISCRLANARYGSIVSWLLYATVVLAFPWYDYLTLVTYAINYLWAATAAAAAIFIFLKIRHYSGIKLIGGLILMFVAGWIHEGFGAPLCAGITLIIILNYKKTDRRSLFAWIMLCAGTCMTFLSPVFWQRSERTSNFLLKFTYQEALMQIGPALLYLGVFLLLIICVFAQKTKRHESLKSLPLLIFIVSAAASAAVFLKYYTGPRTGAPLILYSALGSAYILSKTFNNLPASASLQWIAGILLGGFSIAHLVYTDIAQQKCTEEYEEVTRLYQASDDGTFFYDLSYPRLDLTLYKTSVRQFHEKVPKEFMRIYFDRHEKMTILPSSMQGFSPQKAKKSEFSPGALIYNGWIVIPEDYDISSTQRIHIITESDDNLPSRFRVDRFYSLGYGPYLLLTPHIKVLDPALKIKDVILSDDSR